MKQPSNHLEEVYQRLHSATQALPGEISRDWFDATLFQCRSTRPLDYLDEIKRNVDQLQTVKMYSESYNWLINHLDEQLNAYTQALFRAQNKFPNGQKTISISEQKQQSLAVLHKDLATHHDYERRLQDNLRNATEQADVLRAQQRLLRCQRAIGVLEEKIRRAEG
ncbi:primosomal replication protein PriC [Aliidiomarina sp. Khilg15.8]